MVDILNDTKDKKIPKCPKAKSLQPVQKEHSVQSMVKGSFIPWRKRQHFWLTSAYQQEHDLGHCTHLNVHDQVRACGVGILFKDGNLGHKILFVASRGC